MEVWAGSIFGIEEGSRSLYIFDFYTGILFCPKDEGSICLSRLKKDI
jgi:hypothetical protein